MDIRRTRLLIIHGVALVVIAVALWATFLFAKRTEETAVLGAPVAHVVFTCDQGKEIDATFFKRAVHLEIARGVLYLPQTMSASGARYASADESFVFWNKGDTAFITEGASSTLTFSNCVIKRREAI